MNKKRIGIICVNFESCHELLNYIESINDAVKNELRVCVDVYIADNSVNEICQINTNSYKSINVCVYAFKKNLGYLGGVYSVMSKVGIDKFHQYDYLIISNVDLVLSENFFSELLKVNIKNDVGWIAPKIISQKEGCDRNPKILKRPNKKHINYLLVLFYFPVLYMVYRKFIYSRKKQKANNENVSDIYAGHGSIMIFTRRFIQNNVVFEYDSFLFGEELYIAEMIRLYKMRVIYCPNVLVYDIDHVSTGKINLKKYCMMNYESLKLIKNKYYI